MLHSNGPGGRGSIPALVARTGLIQPVSPANVRRDISMQHVESITRYPVDETLDPQLLPSGRGGPQITPLPPSPPSMTTAAVAQTVVATPPQPMPIAPPGSPPADRKSVV